MRCPKCHYISFDSGDRCRNCGYDFSLAVDVAPLDLPIQTGEEPAGPLVDLQLSDPDEAPPVAHGAPLSTAEGGRLQEARASRRSFGASALDLPLFSDGDADDDRPLVSPPAVPRAPLAVRRASPSMAPRGRAASQIDEAALALDVPEVDEPLPSRASAVARQIDRPAAASEYVTAPLGRRGLAGAIDGAIVLGIDAAILYFTLRLSGLALQQVTALPPVPFLTFILLLNGGYFASFVAAGGQTIGKMAANIRVVPHSAEAGTGVSFGFAVLRAAAYLVSVLPAGIGLLPALFTADRRTLHDRLAETRVVRG
jgi:uncharacterized RDD family membrane protein YckC